MGKVWLQADYSQADARVCAWWGPISTLKEWFQKGEDIHLNAAKVIGQFVQENHITMPNELFMKTPWQELTKADKQERQIGKNTNHANNYGLGVDRFSRMTGLPERFAKLIQEIHHKKHPGIKQNYQSKIDNLLSSKGELVNPFGRRRKFYDSEGHERSRAAYAWMASSTVADLTLQFLIRCSRLFKSDLAGDLYTPTNIRQMGLDIAIESHDSLNIRVEESELIEMARIVKEMGEIPISIETETLVIPLDFKWGYDWKNLQDLKL